MTEVLAFLNSYKPFKPTDGEDVLSVDGVKIPYYSVDTANSVGSIFDDLRDQSKLFAIVEEDEVVHYSDEDWDEDEDDESNTDSDNEIMAHYRICPYHQVETDSTKNIIGFIATENPLNDEDTEETYYLGDECQVDIYAEDL